MPFQLDEYDVSILQALIKNGSKSFREISRDTGITTPPAMHCRESKIAI
jgi:DNA-binding Lrp family transcriptional regulator